MRDETLLGFDARECSPAADGLWDAPRRTDFLLRQQVTRPLSVDPLVWPSLFDTGQGIGLPPAERKRWRLAGIRPPEWTGTNVDLWENLERLRLTLAKQALAPNAYAVVAVTCFLGDDYDRDDTLGPHRGQPNPATLDDHWQLLGYDVADASRLSGLSNCGYTQAEAESWRRRWAAALNDWHLFADQEDANAFAEATNARVPEHAPFFVYGLYDLR